LRRFPFDHFVALRPDFGDLPQQQFDKLEFTRDLRFQAGRQWSAVAGLEFVKPCRRSLFKGS
jgi:hypothetical protein